MHMPTSTINSQGIASITTVIKGSGACICIAIIPAWATTMKLPTPEIAKG